MKLELGINTDFEKEHDQIEELQKELRQIADETDRLESFVKDALQAAAAWIWLASWML